MVSGGVGRSIWAEINELGSERESYKCIVDRNLLH